MDQQAKKDLKERVTGLGRRTREEIAKWNQMTALRFQTRGKHQTSPASLWGPTTQQNTTQYNISHRYVCSCTAIAAKQAFSNTTEHKRTRYNKTTLYNMLSSNR